MSKESLFNALHDVGWFGLSDEMQDDLLAAGYHPPPKGGCSRRIGSVLRAEVGYCGNPRPPQTLRRNLAPSATGGSDE